MRAALLATSHYLAALRDGADLPDLGDGLRAACGKPYRRIDRFVELALLGSARCVRGRDLSAGCGLYLGSTHGPLTSNIRVQEQMLRERELPKPFDFVNTLGSIAGFYVADNLRLSGPNLFVSRHGRSLEAALETALSDLAAGAVDQALVGVVDEAPLPLANQRQRLNVGDDAVLGEGSDWFLLGPPASGTPEATLALRHFDDSRALESYLAAQVSPSAAVCLSRQRGAGTAGAVRRRFPRAIAADSLSLPFHDGIESAWLAAHIAAGREGEAVLVGGAGDDVWLLHLGA